MSAMQILCISIDFLNVPRICFEGNDKYSYKGLRGPATGTFCKYQLKHKFYVHVVVHSCEILWNIIAMKGKYVSAQCSQKLC